MLWFENVPVVVRQHNRPYQKLEAGTRAHPPHVEKVIMPESSYTKIENPPSPMPWEDYKAIIDTEWNRLLSSIKKGEERRVQAFL